MSTGKKQNGQPRHPEKSVPRDAAGKNPREAEREDEPLDEESLERVMRDAPL